MDQFIVETLDGSSLVSEVSEVGNGKTLYVEGIAMQAEIINGNGRKYPKSVLAEAVDVYMDKFVSKKQGLGELDHPPRPEVKLQEVSHLIENLSWDGNNVIARARILDTKNGKNVRALIEGGWKPTVSTRGMGKLQTINESIQPYKKVIKYKLTAGFDFVTNQSAAGAVMSGVYEQLSEGIWQLQDQSIIPPKTPDWNIVIQNLLKITK